MPRLRHLCALVLTLATTLSGADEFAIEAQHPTLAPDGAMVVNEGFVLRFGQRLLIGDALRWHQANDEVFAQGRVVYTQPGLRLAAARLGLHPSRQEGDAWEVDALFEVPDIPGPLRQEPRRVRLRAAHAQVTAEAIIFTDVEADSGHGGVAGFRAPRITAWLRPESAVDRSGPARHLEGMSVQGPTAALGGVPVLWLPYLYRDFTIDYPWTRFEAGHSKRQGIYLRGWIGTSLPPLADWRTRVAVRMDSNSRNGEGVGALAGWRHPWAGQGQLSWLRYPEEAVKGPADDRTTLATREQQVVDVEHRVHGRLGDLGGWGAAARWLQVPEREDRAPGVPEDQPGLRFRSDYLENDVDHRPYARRGVEFAATTGLLTVVADTRRRVSADDPATERWAGLGLGLVPIAVIGPIHLTAESTSADLRRRLDQDQALRTRWEGGLRAGEWLGGSGLAWDTSAGLRGLRYDDGTLADVDRGDEQRLLPVADAGLRYRLVGRSDDLTLALSPRIGVELLGSGSGDTLAPWRFDDGDTFDEDRRWLVTGLTGRLSDASGQRFNGFIEARWALREWDRRFGPADELGSSALGEVTINIQGRPVSTVQVDFNGVWDGRPQEWTSADGRGTWWADPRVGLTWETVLVPDQSSRDRWRQEPGVILIGNRYTCTSSVTFAPGGRAVDRYQVDLRRRMVEGELTTGIDIIRDVDGDLEDARFTIGFSLGGQSSAPTDIFSTPPESVFP